MRLQNKIALITSAHNPCGRAIAIGFAREGAHCVALDAEIQRAEQLAAEVRSLGRRAVAFQCDITKKSPIEDVVPRAVAEFGRIDVLLNCSGLTHESDFLNLTEATFNECIKRGPKAYFLACQAVGRQMAEQRSGKIINLSSTDARIGSGESTALSNSAGTAFIGLAYSIARDSFATDNSNVVQSSALAVFNGDANRDFLNLQRVDSCTPGLTATYRLTAYRTTPDTGAGSFVWNGRLAAIALP